MPQVFGEGLIDGQAAIKDTGHLINTDSAITHELDYNVYPAAGDVGWQSRRGGRVRQSLI